MCPSWMHCHQLKQSRQEYPKNLFWDLYYFCSVYFKDSPASTDVQSAVFADDPMLHRKDCSGGKDTPCCALQSDVIALSRWADDHHVLYDGSKSAELPIGARPRTAVKQPPLRLKASL